MKIPCIYRTTTSDPRAAQKRGSVSLKVRKIYETVGVYLGYALAQCRCSKRPIALTLNPFSARGTVSSTRSIMS